MSRQGRGISSGLSNPDTPRKTRIVARAIFGCGGALPEIVRALRRDLIPNGEAMLAEQFHAAAAERASNTAALGRDRPPDCGEPTPRVRSPTLKPEPFPRP